MPCDPKWAESNRCPRVYGPVSMHLKSLRETCAQNTGKSAFCEHFGQTFIFGLIYRFFIYRPTHRTNHWVMLKKMKDRQIPSIINYLIFLVWYREQLIFLSNGAVVLRPILK